MDDAVRVLRIVPYWVVFAASDPTVVRALIALPIAAAMPIAITFVDNCGIPVLALPTVAIICIVVKTRAVAPIVVSMDNRVATVPIAVPAIRAFAAFAMAAARAGRAVASRSTIVAFQTLTVVVATFLFLY